MVADQPNDDGENSTVLATWQYGAGRTTVVTTDAGHKWADAWRESDYYDKLFAQAVRHAMRPIDDSTNFSVATELVDGQVKVVVTANDQNDEFVNFLDVQARALAPDLSGFDLKFEQVAPGRYESIFAADHPGNYLFSIFTGEGRNRLTAGISVPYSSEFKIKESDVGFLSALAEMKPDGGEKGAVIDGDVTPASMNALLETDTFRGTLSNTIGIRDIWPQLLVFCALVFLADVFVRRVALDFAWVPRTWSRIRQRFTGEEREEVAKNISRLKSRKEELHREFDSRSPQLTDEEPTAKSGGEILRQVLERESASYREPKPKPTKPSLMPESDESYTSRLLRAKRKAQEESERRKGPADD